MLAHYLTLVTSVSPEKMVAVRNRMTGIREQKS